MFDFYLQVPVWQWIVSQSIGAVLICVNFLAWQSKDKLKMLKWFMLTNALAILVNGFLLNWIIVAAGGVGFAKVVAYAFIEVTRRKRQVETEQNEENKNKQHKKDRTISIIILIAVLLASFATMIFTVSHPFDYVIIVGKLISTYAMWRKGVYMARIGSFIYASLVAINSVMFLNLIGLIMALTKIISIVVVFVRLCAAKRKRSC